MTMLNLARNFLAQGLNGVYISLEMGEATVSKRLDSMISHIAQGDLFKDMHKVADSISKASKKFGQFRIKRFPENRTNVNDIRGWLTQLEQASGFKPDFIIVDYIDIMGTTAAVSLDNMFTKDKYVTEEIRSLGFDYNCIMVSAAQLGRCIDINSMISMADGSYKRIGDVIVGDKLKGSESPVTVLNKTVPEKKKSYKIKLKNGQTIIASGEHRFPTSTGEVKSISSGLKIGDSLITG